VLGMIYRSFTCKSKHIIMKLYKSLVRPHLDYCSQVWRPHLRKDIDLLERVQKRATRMIDGYKDISYEERLRMVGLTTLERRMWRADMLEVFKIINGMEGLKMEDFFKKHEGITRGHTFKLYKKRVNLDVAKFNFSNRVCNDWNQLPDDVVAADSVNAFKGRLDDYIRKRGGLN
jgi:ribonucleases P/MRP protein subunit RPP40